MQLAEEAKHHGIRVVVITGEPDPFVRTKENIFVYYQCSPSEALGMMQVATPGIMGGFNVKPLDSGAE